MSLTSEYGHQKFTWETDTNTVILHEKLELTIEIQRIYTSDYFIICRYISSSNYDDMLLAKLLYHEH